MSNKRTIGRWYIGETLGKGGYSWVKKGIDIKTGKIVALKFMEKADSSWAKEQAQQVETEIGSLKNIRHKNVMKLYAYNLNAQYPTKMKNQFIDTILLVLEYAPGGELFDILYYTSKLEPIIGRTYFRQFMAGLDACHKSGVVHRDLKPQNLLLDGKYNLKITDFGLSKIVNSDSDALMKTSYVGTRGYQAPELLLKKKYDKKCDVFSAGVILFILLAGYPPFEQSSKDDKWYKPLTQGKTDKFWHSHRKSKLAKDKNLKDLLEKMLAFEPSKRASLSEVINHKWCKEKVLNQKELARHLRVKHIQAEEKRRKDVRKMQDLNHSISKRDINFKKVEIEEFNDNYESEYALRNWVYAHGDANYWQSIYLFIEGQVAKLNGKSEYDRVEQQLNITIKLNNSKLSFFVKVYRSKFWTSKVKENIDEVNEKTKHVYVVEAKKTSGNDMLWKKIQNEYFHKVWCNKFLNDLPKWAEIQEAKILEDLKKEVKEEEEEQEEKSQEDDDSYYKELDNFHKQKI